MEEQDIRAEIITHTGTNYLQWKNEQTGDIYRIEFGPPSYSVACKFAALSLQKPPAYRETIMFTMEPKKIPQSVNPNQKYNIESLVTNYGQAYERAIKALYKQLDQPSPEVTIRLTPEAKLLSHSPL